MIARRPTPGRVAAALPWVGTAIRLAVGGILLCAGGLKAIDLASSVEAVRAYALLPPVAATAVGWLLPFVEIVIGLALVAGVATRAVALAATALLAVFVVAVVSAAARGLSIDCGCFGGGGAVAPGQTDYTGEIVRDLVLVGLAAWLVLRPQSRLQLTGSDLGMLR